MSDYLICDDIIKNPLLKIEPEKLSNVQFSKLPKGTRNIHGTFGKFNAKDHERFCKELERVKNA